ncbi:hypothetical protein D3C73_1633650 [compost metagenome]
MFEVFIPENILFKFDMMLVAISLKKSLGLSKTTSPFFNNAGTSKSFHHFFVLVSSTPTSPPS